MKAIVIDEFGGPATMMQRELPQPVPGDDEVLIRIAYAGVNPIDWKIREGLMAKVFPHQFPITLGWDASGTIVQVGRHVAPSRIGQFVFAYCRQYGTPVGRGTYAEFIALPAAMAVVAPANLHPAQAAAIPLPALTAWQGLHTAGQLVAGETVLITGGAGGVGSMAIQIALHAGARVLTVASLENHAFVLSLGAHAAIDYRGTALADGLRELAPDGVNLLLDCVGGTYLSEGLRYLRPGGRMVTIAGVPDVLLAGELGVTAQRIVATANPAQLQAIADLLAAGTLVPPPLEEMDLADVTAAHAKSKAGHVRGKIVLKVAEQVAVNLADGIAAGRKNS
ncbi:NADP-dependent oxidoreductase [Actimicrobium antarcticum]|uniref:NADP-dependent oxidoreductase n=1 Tax=Actimicrobium antarcticum TaxID=1051899 RepID=A0ABP7SXJ1_9BURK